MNFLDLIKKIRQQFVDLWQRVEKRDRTRFFLIAGVAIVVIVAAVVLLTRTDYVVLFSQLDAASAQQVTTELQGQGIAYRTADGGTTVLVPEERRDELNISFASQGVPQTGISYDLFSQGSGLTTSDYEKHQYELYQKQENLRTAIRKINGVSDAIVLLAVPENSYAVFQTEIQDVTASVILTMEPNEAPTQAMVQTVENLVANAVAGLSPDNVSVTDNTGAVLKSRDDVYSTLENNYAYQNRVQRDLESAIMGLLRPLFGQNHVRVVVNTALNFDDHAVQNTFFSPVVDEDGIVISSQTINEQVHGTSAATGEPGIDENGGADEYTEIDGNAVSDYSKLSETINYEVNKVEEQIQKAKGSIEHLTISVVVDSGSVSQENSNAEAIRTLVGGATGLEKADYGLITVAFQTFDGVAEEKSLQEQIRSDQQNADMMELIRTLVLYAIIGACVITLMVKAMSLLRKKPSEAEELAMEKLGQAQDEINEYGELVKLATLGAQIEVTKSPTRERVEEFIENNPDAVANLLRNWLSEDYGKH